MFAWSNVLDLTAAGSDPDKERAPPPPPTPLDFPIYSLPDIPERPSEAEAEASLRAVQAVLASIRRPQDISLHRFKGLNLKLYPDIPASDIAHHDGAKTAPPLPWEMDSPDPSLGQPASSQDGISPVFMDNGNAYPPTEKFEVLRHELLLDNDDAFREVARLPPRPGRERVRLTQARKFWTALERMSQYWDASLDEYFERPKSPKPPPEGPQEDGMHTDAPRQPDNTPMDVDTPSAAPADAPKGDGGPADQQPLVKKYKGRRIASGTDMPEDVRDEAIRALTEMAAWPFGCQVSIPIVPPRLAVGTLLFPVRQTFSAARSPKDRQLAKSGVLEGPVFVAQCRPDVSFRGAGEAPGSGLGEACDLVREVVCMLLAAQERAREGTVEVRPGEGKWWTTTPRWGGAPNDAIGDSAKVTEEAKEAKEAESVRERKRARPLPRARRPGLGRKMSSSEKWKLVQPGPSLWDRRMRYLQIGKQKDSPFDDIYMLSSINHHLSILHLRIHRRYLDILTTGKSSFPSDSDPDYPWHVLKLRRTRWYDLFDPDERLEVFKGIWTLFHCLLRSM